MDALILAARSVALSMETAWARLRWIERRHRRKRQILLGNVPRLQIIHTNIDADPRGSNCLASLTGQGGHSFLNALGDRTRIVSRCVCNQYFAAPLPAVWASE
jgi:hypothetical protein